MTHAKKPVPKLEPTDAATDEVLLIEDLAPPHTVVGGARRIVFGQSLHPLPPLPPRPVNDAP